MQYEITTDWAPYLKYFSAKQQDIYFYPQYAKLYEAANETAVCFAYKQSEHVFLFPFLKRSFVFDGKTYFDFETPYGYGGPISNTDDDAFLKAAFSSFYEYASSHEFVCGFTRFHPMLQNSRQFDSIGHVLFDRKTVAIDLTQTENEMWMHSLAAKNRSTIKKAVGAALRFEADYEFKYLDKFISLYNSTMNKLGADDFYLFDRAYYKNWIQNIPNSFLGVVLHEDRVISAAIFFYSDTFGHYHLAGSDPEYLSLNPNNFMLWEAAKELKKKDIHYFHLGGGSDGAPDNSLLAFKARFSPLRFDFNIGKLIFNRDIYDKICAKWETDYPEKAFKFKNVLLKYKY